MRGLRSITSLSDSNWSAKRERPAGWRGSEQDVGGHAFAGRKEPVLDVQRAKIAISLRTNGRGRGRNL